MDRHEEIREKLIELENKYGISLVLAAAGGSKSIGLDNKYSDDDIYVIYTSVTDCKIPKHISGLFEDVDFSCCSLDEVKQSYAKIKSKKKLYPTCLYRTIEEDMAIKKQNMYERDDYGVSLMYYTLLGEEKWTFSYDMELFNKQYGYIVNVLDVADYYYSKAYGNFTSLLKKSENVQIRKYLATIHSTLYCKLMIETESKPPLKIESILTNVKNRIDPNVVVELIKMIDVNRTSDRPKSEMVIEQNSLINDFIENELIELKEFMEKYEGNNKLSL